MTLNGGAITSAIAALSPLVPAAPGVNITVVDVTNQVQQVQPRDCPIMFPMPNGLQGGSNSEPSDGPETFGTPTTRSWVFNRTYKYVYLHAPVGSGRGLKDHNPAMIAANDAINLALVQLDIAGVDVKNVTINPTGTLKDPSGGSFYGFTLSFTARERINA